MVLEATMIVIDNSEFMRNGDYTPTRFQAQTDAVSMIFNIKTQANPENTVGLMSMGGSGPKVLATLTSDFGKILSGLHETKIEGTSHLATGIQVAALALKHRQNKIQRQRVIVFAGSLIEDDTKELVKLAKKMKKNNVAVDFINFGEEAENTEKLEKFRDGVNSNENSRVVTVPPGPHLLANQISPLFIDGEFGGDEPSIGVLDQFDPNVDPELALALRMSLEDEKARQEKVKKEQAEKEKAQKDEAGEGSSSSATADATPQADGAAENAKKDTKDDSKTDKDGDDLMEL